MLRSVRWRSVVSSSIVKKSNLSYGTRLRAKTVLSNPVHPFRTAARNFSRDKTWNVLSRVYHWLSDAPRSVATAIVRHSTVHDYLRTYHFRFQVVD
ncbi:hypothetical protein TNCV_120561 [Trichonephila clavipes]|nr:hypothetical protein TNCV_120561 [Trichonephila clavipes]